MIDADLYGDPGVCMMLLLVVAVEISIGPVNSRRMILYLSILKLGSR